MKKTIALSIIVMASFLLYASLSIEEMDAMMLCNNPDIRKAEENVVQAGLDYKDAKANFFPQITFSGSATYMTEPLIGPVIMESSDLLSQMGLGSYADSASGYVTLYDGMEKTMYMGTLSLTQPLITWGKLWKAADLYDNILSAQTLRKDDTVAQLKAELRIRAWSLRYLEEMKECIERAMELSGELVDLSREGYENGMLLKQDWLSAEISAMELEVKDAELEGQNSSVLDGLCTLIGDFSINGEDIETGDDESFLRKYDNSDLSILIALATGDDSNNLKALKNLKGAYINQKKIASRSMYGIPDFALQVDFSYRNSRFPFLQTGWKQNDNSGINLSIGFKTTLWDGGKAINNLNRASSNIRVADAEYDSAVSQLTTAVKSNWNSVRSNTATLDYLEKKKENLELELENIRIEMEFGQKSRSDELQKLLEIVEVESEMIATKISLVQNVFTLDYLTGEEF